MSAGVSPRLSARDDVGAAAAGIRVDRLPVREDDDGENGRDDEGDRAGDAERSRRRRGSGPRRISSVAYATDDSASDDSTARPIGRDSRS